LLDRWKDTDWLCSQQLMNAAVLSSPVPFIVHPHPIADDRGDSVPAFRADAVWLRACVPY